MSRFARFSTVVLALLLVGSRGSLPPAAGLNDHFDGVRFFNPQRDKKRAADLIRWISNRDIGPWPDAAAPAATVVPPRLVAHDDWHVTFVNHSTVLIQHRGLNILTDPIWSERTSPVGWAGPRRRASPGVRFEDLPPLHTVIISHNHYDHMDMPTLKRIADRHNPFFIVPAGNSIYLNASGIGRVIELDWWEKKSIAPELDVIAVPARHWSRRGVTDLNRALWSGFVLKSENGESIFFAGDSGMGPHFEQIRERIGAPTVAMLPIGSYLPRWFMKSQHMNPAEAVAAHGLLDAETSVAIHFGTFPLADDGFDAPPRDLRGALAEAGLTEQEFRIPQNGTRYRF